MWSGGSSSPPSSSTSARPESTPPAGWYPGSYHGARKIPLSEGALTPFTPEGVPTDEFAALLDKGKVQGELTPDDLMQVLERVELSSDVINAVKGRVQAEGIALVDEDVADDELDPEDPEVGKILREVLAEAAGGEDGATPDGEEPEDEGPKPSAM